MSAKKGTLQNTRFQSTKNDKQILAKSKEQGISMEHHGKGRHQSTRVALRTEAKASRRRPLPTPLRPGEWREGEEEEGGTGGKSSRGGGAPVTLNSWRRCSQGVRACGGLGSGTGDSLREAKESLRMAAEPRSLRPEQRRRHHSRRSSCSGGHGVTWSWSIACMRRPEGRADTRQGAVAGARPCAQG